MNERIGDLMYRAGLTAQGCWDEMDAYDRKAIMTLAELIIQECASICYNSGLKDPDAHAQNLLFHFNVDDCKNDK